MSEQQGGLLLVRLLNRLQSHFRWRRNMSSRILDLVLGTCVFFGGLAAAQTPKAHSLLVQQLESSDPYKRGAAFSALQREPGGFTAPGMAAVLRQALERENQLIYSTLSESNGKTGISDKYGEGFSEYTAALPPVRSTATCAILQPLGPSSAARIPRQDR
jgi:hypothetical protein